MPKSLFYEGMIHLQVLVINGSPKSEKSNTIALTRAFLEGAGWPNAEIINTALEKT